MEVWKQVHIAPNYEASTLGRIRNIKTGRILKSTKNMWGYPVICLQIEGKGISVLVHRVVALTFISNPDNKPSVDHKNRIRDDNHVENLRWSTPKEQNNNKNKSRTDKLKLAARSVTLNEKGPSNVFAAAKKNQVHGILKHTSYGFLWEYERTVIHGEEWKELEPKHINGENGYKISSEGRIELPNGRIKSIDGNEDKYLKIKINKRGFLIHRLVALTFIPNNNPEKTMVNHIDGNKNNPRLSNLEWVTPSENAKHAVDTNLLKNRRCVRQYDLKGEFIAEFPSIKHARDSLGVKVIYPHLKISCNSQWRFKEGDFRPITDLSQNPKIGKNYRIKQFDMKGDFIQEFNSFTEACLSLGLGKRISIWRSSSYNFQWRRSSFDDRPLLDLSHRDKKRKIE